MVNEMRYMKRLVALDLHWVIMVSAGAGRDVRAGVGDDGGLKAQADNGWDPCTLLAPTFRPLSLLGR